MSLVRLDNDKWYFCLKLLMKKYYCDGSNISFSSLNWVVLEALKITSTSTYYVDERVKTFKLQCCHTLIDKLKNSKVNVDLSGFWLISNWDLWVKEREKNSHNSNLLSLLTSVWRFKFADVWTHGNPHSTWDLAKPWGIWSQAASIKTKNSCMPWTEFNVQVCRASLLEKKQNFKPVYFFLVFGHK